MSFVCFLVFLLIEIFDVTNGQQSYKCIKVERFDQISNCSHCNALLSRIDELENQVKVQQENMSAMSAQIDKLISMHNNYPQSKLYHCSVGLMDHRIPDSSFNASSTNAGHKPQFARYGFQTLNGNEKSGYWASKDKKPGDWLQVDLLKPIRVIAVVTQGRPRGDEWIKKFTIMYGNDTNDLQTIQNDTEEVIFHAGPETVNKFPFPITARFFRLIAKMFEKWVVLRLEYLTC